MAEEKRRQSQRKPSRLLGCPVEVQLVILSFVPKGDLVFVSRVNKHLRKVVQPLLHKELDISCPPGNSSPLVLAIRTLLERPDLANEVQHLRLDGFDFPPRTVDVMPITPVTCLTPKRSMKKAVKVMMKSGLRYAADWATSFKRGEVDSVVSLLLVLLPKVRTIYFGEDFCIELLFMRLLLDCQGRMKPDSTLHGFEHLRHVTVRNQMATHYHDGLNFADTFRSFFHFSGLETLTISGDYPEDMMHREVMTFEPMRRLRSLDLTRISEGELDQILALAPNLKKLRYTYAWHPRREDEDYSRARTLSLNLTTLRKSLECHRTQLEHLDLMLVDDTKVRQRAIWNILLCDGPLNLHDFSSLRTLTIPWMFLAEPPFGPHTLPLRYNVPDTVETLTLVDALVFQERYWTTWDKRVVKKMVVDYLHHAQDSKTSLRKLFMVGHGFGRIWSEDEDFETYELARSAGIRFDTSSMTPTEVDNALEVFERMRRYGSKSDEACEREIERVFGRERRAGWP
ncbi:DNA mismatch repair [Fusarium beomiforme]|uniref:DNA mismatch repair n=1 Tax=Fusarium beomiforme TaxID=44412 RepID=A0A9P5AEE4_9HYPO|nr:DNA mismatch repair [Fusarium beomiforme]